MASLGAESSRVDFFPSGLRLSALKARVRIVTPAVPGRVVRSPKPPARSANFPIFTAFS